MKVFLPNGERRESSSLVQQRSAGLPVPDPSRWRVSWFQIRFFSNCYPAASGQELVWATVPLLGLHQVVIRKRFAMERC